MKPSFLIATVLTEHGDDSYVTVKVEGDEEQATRFQVEIILNTLFGDYLEAYPARAEEFMTLVAAGELEAALACWGEDQDDRSITLTVAQESDCSDKRDIQSWALSWLKANGKETSKGDQ